MSNLQYYSYPGFGEENSNAGSYSQTVRIDDRIKISGQGGWDPATGKVKEDLAEQIDQAFSNVDLALRHAGGKGWSQVYSINIYSVNLIDQEGAGPELVIGNMKKWMPNHKPLVTWVGVHELFFGMRIEIEVVALDKEGARNASVGPSK